MFCTHPILQDPKKCTHTLNDYKRSSTYIKVLLPKAKDTVEFFELPQVLKLITVLVEALVIRRRD